MPKGKKKTAKVVQEKPRALRWSDTVLSPERGVCLIPDMVSTPAAAVQSFISAGAAVKTSTSYGSIAAAQLWPRGGPSGCYRTATSVTADTITWTAWQPVPNYTALSANSAECRCSAASITALQGTISASQAAGTLYAAVSTYGEAGGTTAPIAQLLNAPRIVGTIDTVNGYVRGCFGFSSPSDYQYLGVGSNSTDLATDVISVFCLTAPATSSLSFYITLNWELNCNRRDVSILQVMPSVVDMADLQRGLRKLAAGCLRTGAGQLSLGTGFPLSTARLNTPMVTNAALTSTPTSHPAPEAEVRHLHASEVQHPSETAEAYLSQAAAASRDLRTIVTNSAAAAGALLGTAALVRASNSQPRLQQP